MYRIEHHLNNYYIIDIYNEKAYVVNDKNAIGNMIKKFHKKKIIEKDEWKRLCKISGNEIRTIPLDKCPLVPFENLPKKDLEDSKKAGNRINNAKKKTEELNNSGKNIKVNRDKSLAIKKGAFRLVLGTIAFLSAMTIANIGKKKSSKVTRDDYRVEKSIDDNDKSTIVNTNYSYDNNYNNDVKKYTNDNLAENNDYDNVEYRSDEKNDDAMDFYYDEYDVSEESAKNVMQYIDLCKKYGDMYGEDYRVFAATLAQENNGIHNIKYNTPAISISQMEKLVWLNTKIRAYNREKKAYVEKWIIAPNVEETIDDEEFNKRPKSGDIIAEYGEDNVINIETAEGAIEARAMMDAFYREQAYKNGATEKISESDFPAYTKARENKGPIIFKTLAYGDDWENHLNITNNGDDDYVKKVFSFAKIISDYCQDDSPYITSVFDNNKDEIIIFAINAIPTNKLAKVK